MLFTGQMVFTQLTINTFVMHSYNKNKGTLIKRLVVWRSG